MWKPPSRDGTAEHARGEAPPLGVQAERRLDRRDALVVPEKLVDVAPREHEDVVLTSSS